MREETDQRPTRIVACPTCRKSVPWTSESAFRPFCSERCRLIDLGAWAEERHHIPGDAEHSEGIDEER